jgi:hypothetical protein
LWRRPRPKLGCGAKKRKKEEEEEEEEEEEDSVSYIGVLRCNYTNVEYWCVLLHREWIGH